MAAASTSQETKRKGADLPVRPPSPFAMWCADLLVDGDDVLVIQDPESPHMETSDILGMIADVRVDVDEGTPLSSAPIRQAPVIIFPAVPPREVSARIEEGLKRVTNGGVVAVQTALSATVSKKLLSRKCPWTQAPLLRRAETPGAKPQAFYVYYNGYMDPRRLHETRGLNRERYTEGTWYDRVSDGVRIFIKHADILAAKKWAKISVGMCSDIWEDVEVPEEPPDDEDFENVPLQELWLKHYRENKDLIAQSGDSPFPSARTVYIIGAGPSLNGNWEALRDIKREDSMVLCVNKALTKLWSHGIQAPYVIASDVRCAADWGMGVNLKEVEAWLGPHTGHPFAALDWKARNWYRMSPNCPVNREAKEDFPHLPCLTSGVSTTACATSLAARVLRKGGAPDPMVVFVGQDMCYPGGKYHAKGAEVPHDSLVLSTASKQVRWLRGLDGKWYWTSKAFYDARTHISIQASWLWEHGVRTVNASESPAAALRAKTAEGEIEFMPLKDVVAEREATTERGTRKVRAA